MPYLLLIGGLVGLVVLLTWWFVTTPPAVIKRTLAIAVPLVAAAAIVVLAVKSWFGLLLGAMTLAMPWIGRFLMLRQLWRRVRAARGPRPGQGSDVRTGYLAMSLDHDSGAMSGVVLAGPLAGRQLEMLDLEALMGLLAEVEIHDPNGYRVLEAYLDWRFGEVWRQNREGEGAANGGGDRSAAPPGPAGVMSREDAYQILGLEPGADEEAIKEAHRRLIQKVHPDRGGSAHLTAQLNAAKDRLLS